MPDNKPLTGVILEIQRMSTEDGPGIRTTVFMKGCPMRCAWCHNPESIVAQPQVEWIAARCIACKTCLKVCPERALSDDGKGIVIDRSLCTGCGVCAEACPGGALEMRGKTWEVGALLKELLKDAAFFKVSGGGVTVSGGEATFQGAFVTRLLQELKQAGVHSAVDTCGIVKRATLEAILPFTDIVLYDLKEMDAELHRQFTGAKLEPVLENLGFISDYIQTHNLPRETWVRTPLIPGATAREENLRRIGAFIAGRCAGTVTRWDLLAFNNLCKDKYTRLGIDWAYKDTPLLTKEELDSLGAAAQGSGVEPGIVHWGGATQ